MKFFKNILFLISVIVFLSLVYIAQFNVFQTDDYVNAAVARQFSKIGHIKDFYFNWGGRYFSYTLNTFIPAGNPHFYWLPKVFPVFYFSALIFGFWLNFKFYFNQNSKEALINSGILFLFYTVSLASISEHFFWLCGANIYFLPIILLIYLIYFLGKIQVNKRWKPIVFLLIFFLMGSNEILAILLIQCILFLYLKKRTSENLFLLLFGIICLSVSVFAPGNFVRAKESTESIVEFIYKSSGIFVANSIYIFLKLCLIVPFFTIVFSEILKKITLKISKFEVVLFLAFSLPVLLLSGVMRLALERALDLLILYLLVIFSLALSSFVKQVPKIFLLAGLVIFLPKMQLYPHKFIYFNVNYNLYNIGKEISGNHLRLYEQELNKRHEMIKNSKNSEVKLPKIKHLPTILYFEEMGEKNKPNYINKQLESFYNKKKIYVEQY